MITKGDFVGKTRNNFETSDEFKSFDATDAPLEVLEVTRETISGCDWLIPIAQTSRYKVPITYFSLGNDASAVNAQKQRF